MNNVFPNENTDIGTDPTMLQVIDSLDVEPPKEVLESLSKQENNENDPGEPTDNNKKGKHSKKEKKKKSMTPNPDKKPHDTLKKVIFVIIILLLMGAVAFGLYFYLSLGNKKKDLFSINDVQVYVGQTISNNISDYGSFSKVDVASCLITGLDKVDINTPGVYEYSVTCDKIKRSAKIEVLSLVDVNFSTNILYKAENDVPTAQEFINAENEYDYLTDEMKLKDYSKTKGGPHGIGVTISHKSGTERVGYAVLYVVETAPSMNLSCTNNTIDKAKYEYSVSDYFIFDENRKDLGNSLRLYNYKFKEVEDFNNALLNVENNKITIDNKEGYFVMDTNELIIKIVTKLDKETISKDYTPDFPTTYTAISSYYTNTKNYTCSN